jgi:hypothetical protein
VTAVIGHEHVVRALVRHLPPAAALLGPAGVGKRTVAEHVMDVHGVLPVDRIELDQLSVQDARSLRERVQVAPFGRVRAVRIRLDQATDAALHALLTVLEAPPATTRFLLVATSAPATVLSRCQVWHCGLLTPSQSEHVLRGLGMSGPAVRTSAVRAAGRALPALPERGSARAKHTALGVLQAVLTRDRVLFLALLPELDIAAGELVRAAVLETLTRRWRVYTPNEPGLTAQQAQNLLLALSAVPQARTALKVRVVLESFLTGAAVL